MADAGGPATSKLELKPEPILMGLSYHPQTLNRAGHTSFFHFPVGEPVVVEGRGKAGCWVENRKGEERRHAALVSQALKSHAEAEQQEADKFPLHVNDSKDVAAKRTEEELQKEKEVRERESISCKLVAQSGRWHSRGAGEHRVVDCPTQPLHQGPTSALQRDCTVPCCPPLQVMRYKVFFVEDLEDSPLEPKRVRVLTLSWYSDGTVKLYEPLVVRGEGKEREGK